MTQPISVVPILTGLEKDKEPFLLENDAFPVLEDVYLYQGKIIKKRGTEHLGRLVQTITDGSLGSTVSSPETLDTFTLLPAIGTLGIQTGTVEVNIASTPAVTYTDDGDGVLGTTTSFDITAITKATSAVVTATGHTLALADTVYIYGVEGMDSINGGSYTITNVVGDDITINVDSTLFDDYVSGGQIGISIGSIDYLTGSITLVYSGGAGDAITITATSFSGRPVMGLFTKELETVNVENVIAFDTVKANLWNKGTKRFEDISVDTAGAEVLWSGTDAQFFWAESYYTDNTGNNLTWVTNNKQYSVSAGGLDQDGISIYNSTGWSVQNPLLTSAVAANRYLNGCKILIAYKNRMLALNTLESSAVSGVTATRHNNRVRWSQNGVPYTDTLGGADATSWYDDQVGKGGYIDAPTAEAIVSASFYKDVLIVFFERSTWQLTYTGEPSLPFVWNRINSNYGCESAHSIINFDKGIMAVGDKAIIASDSYNVERIDEKIPLEVFKFHNQNDGPARVYGIRDFFFRFAYWAFPNLTPGDGKFPNRVLVFNYDDGSYSIFNDSYTCFGYYQASEDITWEQATFSWESSTRRWNSSVSQSDFPQIIAGNQVGFVNMINKTTTQDISLYVTNISQAEEAVVTAPNHNLVAGQYVSLSDVQGMTEINDIIGKIVSITDANTIVVDIDSSTFTAYTISGYLSVKSNLEVITKRYNPFFTNGNNVRIKSVDLLVNKTVAGQFTIEVYIDTARTEPVETIIVDTSQTYGPTIGMEKMWQRLYLNTDGQFVQFKIKKSDEQMKDVSNEAAEIIINAMNIWVQQTGNLVSYIQ